MNLVKIVIFVILSCSFASLSFAGDLTIEFINLSGEGNTPEPMKLGKIWAVKGSTVYAKEGSCVILGKNAYIASIDFSLAFSNDDNINCFFRIKKKEDQVVDQAKNDTFYDGGFYWVFRVGTYEVLGIK